jgi:antitoxin (DNA-binding transcriptional repressor) of toxin-antitoxin stability system
MELHWNYEKRGSSGIEEPFERVRSGSPLGEGVLVTDRGEVVAELLPPRQGVDQSGAPSGLVGLARRGQLTLGSSNDAAVYPKTSTTAEATSRR